MASGRCVFVYISHRHRIVNLANKTVRSHFVTLRIVNYSHHELIITIKRLVITYNVRVINIGVCLYHSTQQHEEWKFRVIAQYSSWDEIWLQHKTQSLLRCVCGCMCQMCNKTTEYIYKTICGINPIELKRAAKMTAVCFVVLFLFLCDRCYFFFLCVQRVFVFVCCVLVIYMYSVRLLSHLAPTRVRMMHYRAKYKEDKLHWGKLCLRRRQSNERENEQPRK